MAAGAGGLRGVEAAAAAGRDAAGGAREPPEELPAAPGAGLGGAGQALREGEAGAAAAWEEEAAQRRKQ